MLRILSIGLETIAKGYTTPQDRKLTPLHSAYIYVARYNPRAAREILYQNYYLPDKTLGTSVATVFHYYNRGASVLVDLGDYDRAYEFLTTAVVTRFRTESSKAFERLLLVSLLTKNHARNDISRHVPKVVFDRNKSVLYKFSLLKTPFLHVLSGSTGACGEPWGGKWMPHEYYAYLKDLVSRNYRQEVLLLVRALRERRLRNFDKVYLSVGSATLGDADTDAKSFLGHSLRVHCVDTDGSTGAAASAASAATAIDDSWSSNAGPSSAQAVKLTKDYVYWLVLSGALPATLEEDASSDCEYTMFFSNEISGVKNNQDIAAQITRLHELLNEVTTVAGVMTAARHEVVVPRSGTRGNARGWGGRGLDSSYSNKPIITPSISFTDLLEVEATTEVAGPSTYHSRTHHNIRQNIEDAGDIETDTSGVDTIDED